MKELFYNYIRNHRNSRLKLHANAEWKNIRKIPETLLEWDSFMETVERRAINDTDVMRYFSDGVRVDEIKTYVYKSPYSAYLETQKVLDDMGI